MTGEPLLVFATRRTGLRRRELQEFARVLRDEAAGGRSFCALVAGDAELRRLNRDFLGKDYATDVLSFPSGDEAGGMGDIAISVERAAEQADEFGHTIFDELRILLLHGVLHLAGYDHESDKGAMRRAETRLRKRYGLGAGLIERAAGRTGGRA